MGEFCVRHVTLFKLRPSASIAEKNGLLARLQVGAKELGERLPGLTSFRVAPKLPGTTWPEGRAGAPAEIMWVADLEHEAAHEAFQLGVAGLLKEAQQLLVSPDGITQISSRWPPGPPGERGSLIVEDPAAAQAAEEQKKAAAEKRKAAAEKAAKGKAEQEEREAKEAKLADENKELDRRETERLLGHCRRPRNRALLEGLLGDEKPKEEQRLGTTQGSPGLLDTTAVSAAGAESAEGEGKAEDEDSGAAAGAGSGVVRDPPAKKPPPPPHKPVAVDVRSAGPWKTINSYGLDGLGYSGEVVSVDVRLKGVEALPKENITCTFTLDSFDLKVVGVEGADAGDWRLLRTNLDKDIVPDESSFTVKKNHVIVKLKKAKGEYGFDSWTDLCARKPRKRDGPKTADGKRDPMAGLMDMMHDMYEEGDDETRKVIGEAMLKSKQDKGAGSPNPPMGSLDDPMGDGDWGKDI